MNLPELKWSSYIPHSPTAKQHALLLLDGVREILYGGAAGGGKTDVLLMAALQFVDEPQYSALILRRYYRDLILPNAPMNRAIEWLGGTDANWRPNESRFVFPSGATLTFGHMKTEQDKLQFQGAELQFIGFDELTQFTETQYTYLFSRLRRLRDHDVPLRMRATSNPGGIGHNWVRRRFLEKQQPGRLFIPARLEENPHLDARGYEDNLRQLDPVTFRQLRWGDWMAKPSGGLFKREDFLVLPRQTPYQITDRPVMRVRYWDLAATRDDGNRTVGLLMAKCASGRMRIEDIVAGHLSVVERDHLMMNTMRRDFDQVDDSLPTVLQIIERQPAAAGKEVAQIQEDKFGRFPVTTILSTGSKLHRATPLMAAAGNGRIEVIAGEHLEDFIDELTMWMGLPEQDDDFVDAAAGAYNSLYPEINTQLLGKVGGGPRVFASPRRDRLHAGWSSRSMPV